MGGGSYDSYTSRERSARVYAHQTREEVFSQTRLHKDMNPYQVKIREARDSEEHPNSYPIIIALDETGSMGHIPELLIKNVLPDIMDGIMEAGIEHPQLMFMGIGDCATFREQGPLQIGQFESSDELMEHWLTSIYLEGKGGGNGFESYPLAWYFALRHVVTDAWEKRHQKGVIITIGDDSCQRYLSKEQLERYLGDGAEEDLLCSNLLEQVRERWHVYHIHCDGSFSKPFERTNWEKYLGINAVVSTERDGSDIAKIIPQLVITSYRTETETTEE